MKYVLPIVLASLLLLSTLFLNGNISIGSYFPPLGKILNPHKGFWQNAERIAPEQTIHTENITDEIKIVYDERYVPHIYAQNMEDVLFAQGYLEAQNRLFQMDMISRSVSGNLSEVIANNEAVFKKDIESVTKGHRKTAEFLVSSFEKGLDSSYLHNYTKGANHFIKNLAKEDYPFEYKLMDFEPSLWSSKKSAYVLVSLADMLAGRADDFENNNLREILGPEMHAFLYADNFELKAPIVPKGTEYGFDVNTDRFDKSMNSYGKIYKSDFQPNRIFGAGSNNWAVAEKKSKTQSPILANDPHLGLSLPSIWYELEVHTPDFHAHGVSVPGLAGFMIGFNEHVAWGMTNVGHDIKDFLKISYTDESKTKYVYGDSERSIEIRNELIKRRGAADHVEKVAHTIWGPIIHRQETGDFALHWLRAHQANVREPMVYVDCMRSKSYEDFILHTSGHVSPAQNFLCVDKENIGIRPNGLFGAKQKGDGKFVKDGSIPDAGIDQYIPVQELPHVKNPERGFVSSANQRSTGSDYPYYYNGTFATYRAERIQELLEQREEFGIHEFKELQLDNFSIKARDFLPLFLEAVKNRSCEDILDKLSAWDYRYTKDTQAGTAFYLWYSQYRKMIFDEFAAHRKDVYLKYPFDWKIYELSSQYPDHIIFDRVDTEKRETRNDIIQASFEKICADLEEMEDLSWSAYRPLQIPHVARISGLGRSGISVGGVGEALNATRSRFGPSWRMIVAMGDEVEAHGVYPGGQSGNPASKYYADMLQKWIDGEYYTLDLEKDPNKIEAISTLHIKTQQ